MKADASMPNAYPIRGRPNAPTCWCRYINFADIYSTRYPLGKVWTRVLSSLRPQPLCEADLADSLRPSVLLWRWDAFYLLRGRASRQNRVVCCCSTGVVMSASAHLGRSPANAAQRLESKAGAVDLPQEGIWDMGLPAVTSL